MISEIHDANKARLIVKLRAGGITDARVLSAIENTPRQMFTPELFRDKAYEDITLPIGYQQTLSQPTVVAIMTQALEVGDRMKVLEIGTGSGYQSAVLAGMCRRLYTIERHRDLLNEAERLFAELRIHNITSRVGDGSLGWPDQAPFDRIIVTAASVDIPEILLNQLAVGGIMVIPVGDCEHDQRLEVVRRIEGGAETSDIGRVRFVPLVSGEVG